MSDIVLSFFLALVMAGNPTNTCQKFFVTAPDGYVNVRSSPQVKTGNLLVTLPSGSEVNISQKGKGWLKINLPLTGWLAQNQVSHISCDSGRNILMKLGLPTIEKLGKKSQQGDAKAAESLVKMSPYLDGVVEEVYAAVIAEWSQKNPQFLISILNRQNPTIRQGVLSSLDFGLGIATNPSRQKFEAFLKTLPPDSPTLRDWQRLIPSYP